MQFPEQDVLRAGHEAVVVNMRQDVLGMRKHRCCTSENTSSNSRSGRNRRCNSHITGRDSNSRSISRRRWGCDSYRVGWDSDCHG